MAQFLLSAFADEYAEDFDKQLQGLNQFGIGYTELRFVNQVNVSELNAEQIREVKEKLDAYGIQVSAIGSPLGKISLDEDMATQMEKAKRVFSLAEEVGAKNIRFFSFYPRKGHSIYEDEEAVMERIGALVDCASSYQVTLCHENEAGIYGEDPLHCLNIAQTFGGKVKCVFDAGNFVLDGCTPYPDGLALLSEHIEYFHIKDSLAAGAVVPPGCGEAHLAEVLSTFGKTMQKDTFITLEPHLQTFSGLNALVGKNFDNPYKYPDSQTAFTDAVNKMKEILEGLNL